MRTNDLVGGAVVGIMIKAFWSNYPYHREGKQFDKRVGQERQRLALGILGQSLCGASHRIVVHFTPEDASWRNQIELWFSILARIVIRRDHCTSAGDFI